MRKGIAQLLLLMPIFIIFATIAGFYFYNQNKSTQSQTPLNSAEDEKDTDSAPKTDEKGRPLLPDFLGEDHSKTHQVYESEMLAGDFEIAGRALHMLIDRLTPLVENKE